LGGIGGTTGLLPSLTLGCGAVGGSSSSDNIGPLNLINIRRLAYGTKEIEDIRQPECGADTDEEDRLIGEVLRRILEKIG
jgi:hypothetical protein